MRFRNRTGRNWSGRRPSARNELFPGEIDVFGADSCSAIQCRDANGRAEAGATPKSYCDWSEKQRKKALHGQSACCRHLAGYVFSALCGADILVCRFGRLSSRSFKFTGDESPVNQQAGKPALRRLSSTLNTNLAARAT